MKQTINANRIKDFLAAGYAGFVVQTAEAKRAEDVLTSIIDGAERRDGNHYNVTCWDMDSSKQKEPRMPLEDLTTKAPDFTIAILHNYHWFVDKPPIIQKIQNCMDTWKSQGKAIVILTPHPKIPLEIRKDFMFLKLPLPDEAEIRGCMHHIASSAGLPEILEGNNVPIVQAAKGLTKTEIENVFALSVTTKGKFDVGTINEQKIQTIEKSGLLRVLRTGSTYRDILGYERAKKNIAKMINKRTSKGSMFVGPPGCGKTKFIECTVGEFERIGILINFARLYSKYQGEGSENVEEIIDIIEAVGDCVVIMDEFEKQFSGAASTGEGDSGVARRMTGRWLQFMQERPEGVYMMATCNSFKGIPDEFLRAGRWDGSPFYIGLPTTEEQIAIASYYIKKFDLKFNIDKDLPDMDNWTGAEIEACCAISKNLECGLKEASGYIVPQNKRGFKEADELKEIAVNASFEKEVGKKRRLDKA